MRAMMWGVVAMGAVVVSAACARDQEEAAGARPVTLASASILPPMVRTAPPMVQEAYRFAVANADVLQNIPCYCGCGGMGHTSIRSCYVKEDRPDGTVGWDDHALGCGICVDIARDAMRMLREGKDLRQIQEAVRREYGRYGPPTSNLSL